MREPSVNLCLLTPVSRLTTPSLECYGPLSDTDLFLMPLPRQLSSEAYRETVPPPLSLSIDHATHSIYRPQSQRIFITVTRCGENDLGFLYSMSRSQVLDSPISSSQVSSYDLFQSPKTSSVPISPLVTPQHLSRLNSDLNSNRKRSRYESTGPSAPYLATPNELSVTPLGPAIHSPLPFVNTRYRLAGGLDTPTAGIASSFERDISDQGYRRGRRWSNAGNAASESYFPYFPSALARESNGRSRGSASESLRGGWGTVLVTALGGVAGKVWEFCTAGAFRGFYAGGGRGYAMNGPNHDLKPIASNERKTEPGNDCTSQRVVTTLGGGFPKSGSIPDCMSPDYDSRPSKRLHREHSSDLGASWVLISSRDSSPSRTASRKPPSASVPSPRQRKAQGVSTSPTSLRPTSLHRAASFASTRSPKMKPASAHIPAAYPPRHCEIQAREVTMLRRGGSPCRANVDSKRSPVGDEARKFQAKFTRREEKNDRELERLNKRLTDMIRQGKEALGTTVEVFDGDEDEGYVEGEGSDGKGDW